jgi:hypothetical protein
MVIAARRVSVNRRWCAVASVFCGSPTALTGAPASALAACGCRRADRGSRANTWTFRPVVTGTKAFSCRRQKAFPRTSCRNLPRPRLNLGGDARRFRTSQGASFSAAPRAGLGAVSLPPVIPLGEHRFAWMRASAIFEVTPIVGVTHHGAPIPGDSAGNAA